MVVMIMTQTGEILSAILAMKQRLYGESHDEGDIPAIRRELEVLNSKVARHECFINKLPCRQTYLWYIVGVVLSGTTTVLITKLLGLW